MMEAFFGTWKLVSSMNFDEYLTVVGVSDASCQEASMNEGMMKIIQDGDKVVVKTHLKDQDHCATPGQESDQIMPNGIKVKTTVTMEGGKMVHVHKWHGKETRVEREIKDGQMVVTVTCEGVTSVRTFEKA